MSNKYVSKFFEVTGYLNPYRNKNGHIEYSRFVAVIMLECVAAVLYLFKVMPDFLTMEKPYNLVAYFYKYVLVWPLEQAKVVWGVLKEITLTGNSQVDQIISIGGMVGYIALLMSAYMAVYTVILRWTDDDFLIGDFLGMWCVPLVLGGLWYFGVIAIEYVVALKASLQ
ncbi:hypothetical protein ACTXIV_08345 [Psychrobacter celer]|uniref:hypothetical protein n=1 Tax=Psychrobacter celer TaxID=306572 RepID=UPI003FD572CD